jgi:hypothetical protein
MPRRSGAVLEAVSSANSFIDAASSDDSASVEYSAFPLRLALTFTLACL